MYVKILVLIDVSKKINEEQNTQMSFCSYSLIAEHVFFSSLKNISTFLHVHLSHKMLMYLAAKNGINKHNR